MDHVPQDHQIPADAPTHPATLGSGVQLPMINAEPGTGPSPELVTSLVAHRARDGEVSTLEENYEDPRPSVPHEVTDENIAAGRRSGHYEALCGYRGDG